MLNVTGKTTIRLLNFTCTRFWPIRFLTSRRVSPPLPRGATEKKMEDLDVKFKSDVITGGQPVIPKAGCVFCSIVAGPDTKQQIIYQNSEVAVFHDIRPASREHLLIIPTNHVRTIKAFTREDKPKLEYLYEVGKAVLEKRGGDIAQSRVGFHWPPFNTIEHLHLHIVYPVSEMGLFSRMIYKPNSLFFATYEWTMDWLEKRTDSHKGVPVEEKINKKLQP